MRKTTYAKRWNPWLFFIKRWLFLEHNMFLNIRRHLLKTYTLLMKLFYHFLVLVAASLILVACANMFSSTPEKKIDKPAQRSGIYLGKDSLYNSEINTRLTFSDSYYYDVLNRYTIGNHQAWHQINNNLFIAANYLGLNPIEK